MNKSSETGTEYQTNDVQFIETSLIVANMVASGQKKSWELKFFQVQGKVREFHFEWEKTYIDERSQENVKSLVNMKLLNLSGPSIW